MTSDKDMLSGPPAGAPTLMFQQSEAPLTVDRGGIKHDQDKLPWHLLPFDALEEVAEILKTGAKKYAPRNWERGIDYSRVTRAAMGHLIDWFFCKMKGTTGNDPETGRSHLAHAACCVLFLLAYEKRKMTAWDDRPMMEIPDGR